MERWIRTHEVEKAGADRALKPFWSIFEACVDMSEIIVQHYTLPSEPAKHCRVTSSLID